MKNIYIIHRKQILKIIFAGFFFSKAQNYIRQMPLNKKMLPEEDSWSRKRKKELQDYFYLLIVAFIC